MTTDLIRIFVNAQPVDAQPGDTALTAIERWDPTIGKTLSDGARALTDSRGLVTSLDTPVCNGAIFRIVSNRQLRESDDPYDD
jgi:hypothetical protein